MRRFLIVELPFCGIITLGGDYMQNFSVLNTCLSKNTSHLNESAFTDPQVELYRISVPFFNGGRTLSEKRIAFLADNIKFGGFNETLNVRITRDSRFILLSDPALLHAARRAGVKTAHIRVCCHDFSSAPLLQLTEVLEAQSLNYIEEALCIKHLFVNHRRSQQSIAKLIGKSQSYVANKLRLLRLNRDILNFALINGVSERHLRAILPLEDSVLQRSMLERIVWYHLPVRETEKLVAELMGRVLKPKRNFAAVKDERIISNSLNSMVDKMREHGFKIEIRREQNAAELRYIICIATQ